MGHGEARKQLNPEDAVQMRVIVVGGGVSGCACAGRLAAEGAHVTVVSSALDVVGLPGYGPEVCAGPRGWAEIAETLALLPEGLRWAWLNSGALPETGEPVLIVDRRAVSIESKRALETMPGLHFRQGLVTDVRPGASGCDSAEADTLWGGEVAGAAAGRGSVTRIETGVEVETAFGEVFFADAVVLTPGLALRGRIEVGDETLPGGRYGEVPANELCDSLEALGVIFEETTVHVGPRLSRDSPVVQEAFAALVPEGGNNTSLSTRRLLPARAFVEGTWVGASRDQAGLGEAVLALRASVLEAGDPFPPENEAACAPNRDHGWPDEYPPAPHWTEGLRPEAAVLCATADGALSVPDLEGADPVYLALAPDGVSTAEYYVAVRAVSSIVERSACGASGGASDSGEGVTRLGHRVLALVAVGVDPEGRLPIGMERIRIAGRSAGAESYLESLRSGVRVADSLLRSFRGEGGRS